MLRSEASLKIEADICGLVRPNDQRKRVLSEWLDAQAARDSNGDETAWRLKPYSALMFVNGAGDLDQKHDQDLRDTASC